MIIPAIDLLDGRVVRLRQGDYNANTRFAVEPESLVTEFKRQGAQYIHLVDLQGAKDPQSRQLSVLLRLTQISGICWQVGGGIRHREDITTLIDNGAARVVIGSVAIEQPDIVAEWIKYFGAEKIVLALDVRPTPDGRLILPTRGWTTATDKELTECLDFYSKLGSLHILCTDISRDGTGNGANVELYRDLCKRYPTLNIQASGGIHTLDDVRDIADTNISALIIGKALLEKKFTLKEAIVCWQNASYRA